MSIRKSYKSLSPVQATLQNGATAVLECGSVLADIIQLSSKGRYWVGVVISESDELLHEGTGLAKFRAESVVEVQGGKEVDVLPELPPDSDGRPEVLDLGDRDEGFAEESDDDGDIDSIGDEF